MTQVVSPRCEYFANPLGLDVPQPRLSWQLQSRRRGARQRAYRVLVAGDARALAAGAGDLWDSGLVAGEQSVGVVYAGKPLESRRRAWWTVRVWDDRGQEAQLAEPAWWEMGLLRREDWQGRWVGAPLVGGPWSASPCPHLRREFVLGRPAARARLYVTALGMYECTLNGRAVGDDVFSPGWTDFHKRVRYRVYDVTDLLRQGPNVLGAILGDGFYCGHLEKRSRQLYGDRPKLLAQLEITAEDGSSQTIVSDGAWKVGYGPLLESDLIMGECYDARLEMPGWDRSGFDDSAWQAAREFADEGAAVVAMGGPPVRRMAELRPAGPPRRTARGLWIYDLGQNMVGRVRLRVAAKPGATIRLRFAEMLDADGELYTANLRTARATDYYTCRGGGPEEWESRFTFHGFRYVELDGLAGEPGRDAVTGIVLHSDTPAAGEFTCSDSLLNQLQHNIVWGQKGNFLDVPTDCPQRDERLGWMGDAQVFARTAAFNMDVCGFFAKWLQDIRDAQNADGSVPCLVPNSHLGGAWPDGGPAWSDATVICAWTMYLCYGDAGILEEHYDSLARYMAYLEASSRDGLRAFEGSAVRGFGDWLALDGSGGCEGATPKDLIGTAFLAHSARLMVRIAQALGRGDDARRYEAIADRTCLAFQRNFITPAGRVVGQTQTAYVLALHFGLIPDRLRPAVVDSLVDDIRRRGMHLATGFVGTPYLLSVLSANGRTDVAYALLHQTSCPSWLYAVTQGATTIWERWDGWTSDKGFQSPGMNSFNHYAFGAVGEWLYATAAGIDADPDRPGYCHVILRPRPGGLLTHAAAALAGPYGRIESRWRLDDGRFEWNVAVPPNSVATAHVPAADGAEVMEGDGPAEAAEGVKFLRVEDGARVYALGSGRYRFRSSLPAGG